MKKQINNHGIKLNLLVIGILLSLIPYDTCSAGKIKTEFGDSTKTHVFTLGANLLTRGEYIHGALPNEKKDMALFVLERTRLLFNYKQPYLEVQITPEHSGVWGMAGGGGFNLNEAWAQTDYKGFFLKLGRQTLTYDDERVIGLDDWSMTGSYHDALKIGYEGFGHKLHLIGAYNQNDSSLTGGTRYLNGAQVYKNMQTLWYHYDFKRWFGVSLLFINTGMQNANLQIPDTTFYQQTVGSYVKFAYPFNATASLTVDGSFYYQFGRSEWNLPISAWMGAVEAKAVVNPWIQLNTGYFHLSGDENYTVPGPGQIGIQLRTHQHSFNLLYGSHHQFYGAMDFFYLQTFYAGYSPGLQDLHLGATFTWQDQFDFQAQYHYMATSVVVIDAPSKSLGHELELTANYRPFKWLTLTAGYTFMQGTKTMEIVKRATNKNQSHWAYLMLVFDPTLLTVRF